MRLTTIPASEREEWNAWLQPAPHDFYHRAEYHQLAQDLSQGSAYLAVCGTRDRFVAWPYLLLDLSTVPGLEQVSAYDVTSVYGYSGPLVYGCAADDTSVPAAIHAVRDNWAAQNVVTAFTRTHPVIGNAAILRSSGTLVRCGSTVSIDLTLPAEAIWEGYRRDHRSRIRRAQRMGVTVEEDKQWARLDEFVGIYHRTMGRVNADRFYFFDGAHFIRLKELLGDSMHLFVSRAGGEVLAAAIVAECRGIVQYHLSATAEEDVGFASMRLLLDHVREWATAREHGAALRWWCWRQI